MKPSISAVVYNLPTPPFLPHPIHLHLLRIFKSTITNTNTMITVKNGGVVRLDAAEFASLSDAPPMIPGRLPGVVSVPPGAPLPPAAPPPAAAPAPEEPEDPEEPGEPEEPDEPALPPDEPPPDDPDPDPPGIAGCCNEISLFGLPKFLR